MYYNDTMVSMLCQHTLIKLNMVFKLMALFCQFCTQ